MSSPLHVTWLLTGRPSLEVWNRDFQKFGTIADIGSGRGHLIAGRNLSRVVETASPMWIVEAVPR